MQTKTKYKTSKTYHGGELAKIRTRQRKSWQDENNKVVEKIAEIIKKWIPQTRDRKKGAPGIYSTPSSLTHKRVKERDFTVNKEKTGCIL